jgi:polyisoprenoid-binding protein YceI
MTATATPTTELVRTVAGHDVPAAGTYDLDLSHSTVGFVARHLMISKVRGHFSDFSGVIQIADRPEDSSVEVTIDAASITTNDEQRDGHLRSADFFEIDQHPQLTFKSTGVEAVKGDHWKVTGDLTVRGVTKPVVLDVEFEGAQTDPWGGARIGFSASTEIDREDWGLTWNQALETGGVLVGKKIKIDLGVEATRQG